MKIKISFLRGVIFLLTFVVYTGNALATASFETNYGGNLTITKMGGTARYFYLTGNSGSVSTTQPSNDPLVSVGSYFEWPTQIAYYFAATGNDLPTGHINITSSDGPNTINLHTSAGDVLTGLSNALSIDFVGGATGTATVTWELNLTRDDIKANILNSKPINDFSVGDPATLTMSFGLNATLFNFLTQGGMGSEGTGYAAAFSQVTAVPEPGEWALMLVGMGLIGFSIYRKQYQVALPEWQNLRKS